jgi:pimeloyl-ACP methyl ester carboxylesterase
MPKPPVVLIHGMFMTALCWEKWVERFEKAGRRAEALEWPGREAPIEELRARHPDPVLGGLGLVDVVTAHADVIRAMDDRPVLIGHSMGGLVVQLLLGQGLGLAGVAVDSAPPRGVVTTKSSFLKANWPMIDPFVPSRRPHMITSEQFAYAFGNTLSEADQRDAYDRYVVPESRRVPRQSLGSAGRVDFVAPHAPLLLIAGGKDHIIPAALNEANLARYRSTASVTELKEFPGRDHLTITEAGWEEVADFALDWLDAQVGTDAAEVVPAVAG